MARQAETVVLVHGLAAHPLMMKPLEYHLRRNGFATVNWGYSSVCGDIEQHARRLIQRLKQIELDSVAERIHLVTHSMGGIVARAALPHLPSKKISSLVMLGPPNHGSRVARFLAGGLGWFCPPLSQLSDANESFVNQLPLPKGIDIGIIAAQFDRVVAVSSTRLGLELDHWVVPSGHTSMLLRSDVANSVANFLCRRRFNEVSMPAISEFGQVITPQLPASASR